MSCGARGVAIRAHFDAHTRSICAHMIAIDVPARMRWRVDPPNG